MNAVYKVFYATCALLVSFVVGAEVGKHKLQTTIVEECRASGMYLDRNLFMVCQVGTPKVVPKPADML
jgi:hypothetical protein